MNHARLKAAIRYARNQAKTPWKGYHGDVSVNLVSIPVETLNLLLKAATKELQRT